MAELVLQAQRLGHRFGSDPWLFRGLELEVRAGERLAILGPNGRGKSTLLQLLTGARTASEGAITRWGLVGFVPQAFSPPFAFTALDIVLTGRSRSIALFGQPGAADETAALEALAQLDMAWAATRAFDTLSGGERQRVLLARAVASGADLLVLDEPTAALDLGRQQQAMSWIRVLSETGRTIVFTTHDPTEALQWADRALMLFGDKEHHQGPAADVLTADRLSGLYGVAIQRMYASGDRSGWSVFAAAAVRVDDELPGRAPKKKHLSGPDPA